MVRSAWVLLCVVLCGCVEVASTDPGLSAHLQVEGAQYVPGPMPASGDGPDVLSVHLSHVEVLPGERREWVNGTLGSEATSLLIGLEDDPGYFVVTATAPAVEEPDAPSYALGLSFAGHISAHTLRLRLAAADRAGRTGKVQLQTLQVQRPADEFALEVALTWDQNADLDLHVVLPSGVELYPGNVSAYVAPPPGSAPDAPGAATDAGHIDVDSNADCRIDGLRRERLLFASSPPSGTYTVRVVTASLCEASVAHYEVQAFIDGERVGAMHGLSTAEDTRFGTGRGAGTLALSFRVP